VFEFLQKKPNANIIELANEFPQYKKKILMDYKWSFHRTDSELFKLIKVVIDVMHRKMGYVTELTELEQECIKKLEIIAKNVKEA